MKTPHQLLITYTLTPGQLQRITEVSSLIDVHYAPTLEEAKKQFLIGGDSLRRYSEGSVSPHAAASLGTNLDGRVGSIFIPGIIRERCYPLLFTGDA